MKSLNDFDGSVNTRGRYTAYRLTAPFLSIVVPAYNEEARISSCIERLREMLPTVVPSWEIVVADDGSHDRTREIVQELGSSDPRVRLMALPHRGKGETVRRGLLGAQGTWRFMADADLAMPPDNLRKFLELTDETDAAVVIGSREAAGARRVDEPWIRHLIGRVFNWVVRLVVLPGVADTQCGFKLLSARAVETICPYARIAGFAFDVEMLALARRAGLTVREVGITWYGQKDSRVAVGRGAAAFLEILQIRWNLWTGAYRRQPRVSNPDIERFGPASVRTWAYLLALTCAAALSYDLLRMPVQVFDALEEMLAAQRSTSALTSFVSAAYNAAYMRPLRIAQIKLIFDAADGHYWLAFRGFHAALMACCLWLFTRALRVRTSVDLCAAAFALTVLVGLHTFRSTVQEAFPINHFLEIVVFALATVNLAQSRPRLIVDAAALVVFAAAALTLESGLLVWVVAAGCWVIGLRGISTRGLALMTVLLGAYLYARFVSLSVGVPTLVERSSGFVFEVLEPADLQARFGDRPFVFYAYNLAASMLSVLFSEPRAGLFVFVRSWIDGDVPTREILDVGSSIVTTGLILIAGIGLVRRYRSSDSGDRLIPVFFIVLAANAILSFAYTKDDIMSVAGAFYALATYAALRWILGRIAPSQRLIAALVTVVIFVAGTAWSVRSLGIHHVARTYAFKTRNDWARQPALWKRSGRWPADVKSQQLINQLREDALGMRVPNPRFESPWAERLWGD